MLRRRLPLAVALLAVGLVAAQEPPANGKTEKKDEKIETVKRPAPPTGQPFTLGQCLAIAQERQPDIRAAIHSLRAAELGLQGLNGLGRIPDMFSPDLPVRRQQSLLGLQVTRAAVDLARQETTYDVCYLYFSHVYARQAEQTATDVLDQLIVFYGVAEELLNAGGADKQLKIDKQTLYQLQAIIAEVRVLRLRAEAGRRQSLSALRQVMGVGPECDFHPATKELPIMEGSITEGEVVGWAMSRRPELLQATTAVDVFYLESEAQSRIRFRPQVNTLAAGTDLHSRGVPLPLRNGQWRPGALAPEMPSSLVGRTEDRVARACELAARQTVVYEKTAGLVRLEAENAFIDWDITTQRMREAKKRFEATRLALEEALSAATTRPNPQLLVTAQAGAGRAQADYVEAVFEHLKALAKLERVTAGAFPVNFPGR